MATNTSSTSQVYDGLLTVEDASQLQETFGRTKYGPLIVAEGGGGGDSPGQNLNCA